MHGVHLSPGLNNGPVFIFTSFPSLFALCRFCTAAADRKLRLLTSDLQDRHEVKVSPVSGARCSEGIHEAALLQMLEQQLGKQPQP